MEEVGFPMFHTKLNTQCQSSSLLQSLSTPKSINNSKFAYKLPAQHLDPRISM
jgi:hypothetical protein